MKYLTLKEKIAVALFFIAELGLMIFALITYVIT